MTLDELMEAARKLSVHDQRRLAAFLTTLREDSEPSFAEEMARRIDDKNRASWATIEDLDKRFGFTW